MPVNARIRGKEAELQIIFGTTRLGGSMRKITDFSIEPQSEITKTKFVGERRSNMDLEIDSYDFSFNTHVNDFAWWRDVWQQLNDAERLGATFPEITVVVSLRLRNNGPVETIVLSDDLIMKLDTMEAPGDDYVSLAWSGSCQQAQA